MAVKKKFPYKAAFVACKEGAEPHQVSKAVRTECSAVKPA